MQPGFRHQNSITRIHLMYWVAGGSGFNPPGRPIAMNAKLSEIALSVSERLGQAP